MSLRVLYQLSTLEDITHAIDDNNGMEKLMLCLRARNTINEIPRLGAKIVFSFYSLSVSGCSAQ